MSFLSLEESTELGQPIELVKFSNNEENFYYTSAQSEVVFNSTTYIPVPWTRTDPARENLDSRATLVLKFATSNLFVQRYVQGLPSTPDKVVVYRQHSTDGGTPETIIMFSGQVENVAFTGDEAKVNLVSSANRLAKHVPRQTCRNMCNHILYDARCKASESLFFMFVDVTAISSDGLTVTVNGGSNTIVDTGLELSAQITADTEYFNAGVLARGTFEQRSVLSTTDQGGNLVEIGLLIGFQTLAIGQTVKLLAGCDHNFDTCRTQFDNTQNYGGFPHVPRKNPFEVGVDK